MGIEIYYFSGTGNSLAVARDISERIKGTLISIPSVMDKQSIKTEADSIGIVFPCYLPVLFGIPLIVERFIRKLENIRSKYIFAVCTCGGHENVNGLPTLMNLGKIIKSMGGKISAEFSIHLPMNSLDYSHVPFINKNQETMFKNCKKKIEVICQCITGRKKSKHKILKSLFHWLMTPMYLMLRMVCIMELKNKSKEPIDTNLEFYELIPLTDKSIVFTDEKCNGCAICAKVCPVQNIKMIENKPVWQHHCEMCFACDEWCPTKAIHHWGKVVGKDYHHPNVKASDMVRQNRGNSASRVSQSS